MRSVCPLLSQVLESFPKAESKLRLQRFPDSPKEDVRVPTEHRVLQEAQLSPDSRSHIAIAFARQVTGWSMALLAQLLHRGAGVFGQVEALQGTSFCV